MMNGKKTVLATTILFFVLFTTSAAAIQITNVDIDPDEPYEGEGFDITAEAEDYQYMVEEVWIEWETQPSNWDQDSDSVYCGTETCSQEWEDIEFEESGEYEFEILAFSDHIADDDSYSGQVNVQEEDETEPEVEITEVEISEEELRPDEQVNMEATLENTGDADAEDISLEFVAEEDTNDYDEFISIELIDSIDISEDSTITRDIDADYEELEDLELEIETEYNIGAEIFGTGAIEGRTYADDTLTLLEEEEEDESRFELSKNEDSDDWSPDGKVNEDSSKVDINVENTGDAEGTRDIEFDAGFGTDTEEDLTLDSGEDEDIVLEVEPEEGDAGSYDGEISTSRDDEDALSVDITIEEKEEDEEGPTASFDYNPMNPEVDEEVNFDASDSSPGDAEEIETYKWDMQDGNEYEETGPEIDHTFEATGTYDVELTVVDDEDREDSISKEVNVVRPDLEYSIDSLRFLDLPQKHPKDEALNIQGEATGKNLEKLELHYRQRGGWQHIDTRNCNLEDRCTIYESYTENRQEDREFRLRATAGGETRTTTESVRFYDRSDEEDDDKDDEDKDNGDNGDEEIRGTLKATVTDRSGNTLRNARVRAENSETKTRYTDSSGKIYMDLAEGEYSVRASKTGYQSQTKTLDIEESRTTRETFRLSETRQRKDSDLEITGINHKSSVCKGDFLSIDVSVKNHQDFSETVQVSAQGIGNNPSKYMVLNDGEERTKTITATNLDQVGTYSFNINVENSEKITRSRTVKVEDCTTQVSTEATGLSLSINPREVNAGQTVTASGYLDGLRGQRGEITIKADGRTVARTNNDRDGYYKTHFRVHNPGEKTITAESQGLSQSRTLTVHSTVHVESISAPDKVIKGQEFEVCAQVNSQVESRVVLENRDEEVLQAVDSKGETCFTTTARETGEQEYRVRAFTSGNGSSATRTVDVIESGPETEKFPDVVATEQSGAGEFKVELYNTEDRVKEYNIEVRGIDRNWISQSNREVHLAQGERETVYFYLTPQTRGTYHPEVEITLDDETIFQDDVMVQTKKNPYQTRKTFLTRLRSWVRL